MAQRICTSCDTPHLTSDWYLVTEIGHPLEGHVECRAAHEDRVRREVRDCYRPAKSTGFGHVASRMPRGQTLYS